MRRLALLAVVLALALLPAIAEAQARLMIGGGLSQPSGDFADLVDSGLHGRVGLQVGVPVFPVAIRQALPAYGNEIILMVKSTSLASTITILEVTGIAKKIIAVTYATMEVFILAGAIYLAMNFIITRGIQLLEVKLSPQLFRDRAATTKPKVDEVLAH